MHCTLTHLRNQSCYLAKFRKSVWRCCLRASSWVVFRPQLISIVCLSPLFLGALIVAEPAGLETRDFCNSCFMASRCASRRNVEGSNSSSSRGGTTCAALVLGGTGSTRALHSGMPRFCRSRALSWRNFAISPSKLRFSRRVSSTAARKLFSNSASAKAKPSSLDMSAKPLVTSPVECSSASSPWRSTRSFCRSVRSASPSLNNGINLSMEANSPPSRASESADVPSSSAACHFATTSCSAPSKDGLPGSCSKAAFSASSASRSLRSLPPSLMSCASVSAAPAAPLLPVGVVGIVSASGVSGWAALTKARNLWLSARIRAFSSRMRLASSAGSSTISAGAIGRMVCARHRQKNA
mmetsp:Transcript_125993/g.245734  ORF Transcript_125993/g.245734 Transcript_125993/m.245734 type:complete len:354 (+) Transcript_125993:74-1135(+)